MGACFRERKPILRQEKFTPVPSPIPTPVPVDASKFEINPLKQSSIFSDHSCPVENQLIINRFKNLITLFAMNDLDASVRAYQWKKITCPHNESDKIWSVCNWKSDTDNVLDGEGLLYKNQEKHKEFLIGGIFSQGSLIEKGKYFQVFQKGSYYIGEINKDLEPHGEGEIFVTEFVSYKGYFNKGVPHGNGKKKTQGKQFTGRFKNGEIVYGIESTEKGSYEGEFKDGLKHGKGILRMKNGLTYEGQFANNKKNGMGTLKNKDGKILYHGIWRDDKQFEEGKLN